MMINGALPMFLKVNAGLFLHVFFMSLCLILEKCVNLHCHFAGACVCKTLCFSAVGLVRRCENGGESCVEGVVRGVFD